MEILKTLLQNTCKCFNKQAKDTYITGHVFVVFHHLLVVSIDGEYLANTLGCCVSLLVKKKYIHVIMSDKWQSKQFCLTNLRSVC